MRQPDILTEIVDRRRRVLQVEGHAMGTVLPPARQAPLVPFGADPFLVCEIKRRSPSRGEIDSTVDPVARARRYAGEGVASISVLTERDHFGGSLEDIVRIKQALPSLSILRKDFLLDEEDIEVSWRAGADAILLIASILDAGMLARMLARARSLGLAALVEVHDEEDVARARSVAPELVGINSRDLRTFAVDLGRPLALAQRIDWSTRLVFESGIRFAEDVWLALASGFSGVLVGETAMRSPERIPELRRAFAESAAPRRAGGFWGRLLARRLPGRPLAKICGITRPADAEAAVRLGAEALGFVLAPSKRRARPELLTELRGLDALKVGVVVGAAGDGRLEPAVRDLLADGLLDAVQFHGEESPEDCARLAFPYYKAVRVRDAAAASAAAAYRCPRVLADAWSEAAVGGTGQRVPAELARELARARPLWLAGGIGPDNIRGIIAELSPELVDCSSRLEESPGVKDHAKLERFFQEIGRETTHAA